MNDDKVLSGNETGGFGDVQIRNEGFESTRSQPLNNYEPVASNEQSVAQLVKRLYRIGNNWAAKAVQYNLSHEQACQGVVNSILKQLDNGSTVCPAFELKPIPYSPLGLDHRFYPESDGTDSIVLHNWNYGTSLMTEGKMDVLHAERYEMFRDRLSISAADLFS